jgi:hypothetical protein
MEAGWKQAEVRRLTVAVMIFHSSELMPGGSQFFPDRASVVELLGCLDRFWSFVRVRSARFAPYAQAGRGIRTAAQVEVREL